MSNEFNHQQNASDHPLIYQVRLKGHIGPEWTEWFGGLNITQEEAGDTLITGPSLDQAALHGLLKKVRDLGITLISVQSVKLNQIDLAETESSGSYE